MTDLTNTSIVVRVFMAVAAMVRVPLLEEIGTPSAQQQVLSHFRFASLIIDPIALYTALTDTTSSSDSELPHRLIKSDSQQPSSDYPHCVFAACKL